MINMAGGEREEEERDLVVLVVDDDDDLTTRMKATKSSFQSASCRICHEEEEDSDGGGESSRKMKLEAPCACSGTAKYAHRHCIQRWCDIKGDTTCEICLQKFEPDYTAVPNKNKDKTITISSYNSDESSSDDEENIDVEDQTTIVLETTTNVSQCISAAERSASFCKTIAILLTILLVARQLLAVLTEDSADDYYPFSLLTIFVLRACGVIVPMYMIIHSLSVLQKNIRTQRLLRLALPTAAVVRTRRRRRMRRGDVGGGHVTVDIQT